MEVERTLGWVERRTSAEQLASRIAAARFESYGDYNSPAFRRVAENVGEEVLDQRARDPLLHRTLISNRLPSTIVKTNATRCVSGSARRSSALSTWSSATSRTDPASGSNGVNKIEYARRAKRPACSVPPAATPLRSPVPYEECPESRARLLQGAA
jgi:hypothetical protein